MLHSKGDGKRLNKVQRKEDVEEMKRRRCERTGRRKGREGKGREGKGREGKGREGKGREGKENSPPSVCLKVAIIWKFNLSLTLLKENRYLNVACMGCCLLRRSIILDSAEAVKIMRVSGTRSRINVWSRN
jgi:hypothetical protein